MQIKKLKAESHGASKKRNIVERIVVAVKVHDDDDDNKKQKMSEGPPPSDSWSWRKYGQKPIKGSPYPRGYYRCSTSKGCTAKKQVERCKTDASMLMVTYTSTHNHPGPHHLPITSNEEDDQQYPKTPPNQQEEPKTVLVAKSTSTTDHLETHHHLHYSHHDSPIFNYGPSQDNKMIVTSQEEKAAFKEKQLDVITNDNSCDCPHQAINFPTCKSDDDHVHENDFFDELGELPTTSSFTQLLMRSNFVEGRVLV